MDETSQAPRVFDASAVDAFLSGKIPYANDTAATTTGAPKKLVVEKQNPNLAPPPVTEQGEEDGEPVPDLPALSEGPAPELPPAPELTPEQLEKKKKAEEYAEKLQKLSTSQKPDVPKFVEYDAKARRFYLSLKSLSSHAELLQFYAQYSQTYKTTAPYLKAMLDFQSRRVMDALGCGWMATTYVWTPVLYMLLQGPFENPRNERERGASEWPALITTASLYAYYRAAIGLLTEEYEKAGATEKRALENFKYAGSESSIIGQVLTDRFEKRRSAAAAMLINAAREGKRGEPLGNLTHEEQLATPVQEHLKRAEDCLKQLSASLVHHTISLIQLQEALIMELLGFSRDERIQRACMTQYALPPPKLISDEKKLELWHHQVVCLHHYANRLYDFPEKQKNGDPSHTHVEGLFLREQVLKVEPFASDEQPDLKSLCDERGVSLAALWQRMMTWLRLRHVKEKY